jgi:hypothetical protein
MTFLRQDFSVLKPQVMYFQRRSCTSKLTAASGGGVRGGSFGKGEEAHRHKKAGKIKTHHCYHIS